MPTSPAAYDGPVSRRHAPSDLSTAAQEYLLTLRVMGGPGRRATAAQVARRLGVSTQAASEMFRRLVADDLRPRRILTREAFENAIAVVMAVGGSTNAVLHLLAIAHAAEVELTLDDFERIRQRVPVLCDMKPSGRYVATNLHEAGGIPQVMKMLLGHGLLHDDCMTITGKTVGEALRKVPEIGRAHV